MDEDLHELIHTLSEIKNLYEKACIIVDRLNLKDTSREVHEETIRNMLKKKSSV